MICGTQEPPPLRFVSDFVGKTVLNPVKVILSSVVYENLSIMRATGSLTVSTLGRGVLAFRCYPR
jgi:hypothetical protein